MNQCKFPIEFLEISSSVGLNCLTVHIWDSIRIFVFPNYNNHYGFILIWCFILSFRAPCIQTAKFQFIKNFRILAASIHKAIENYSPTLIYSYFSFKVIPWNRQVNLHCIFLQQVLSNSQQTVVSYGSFSLFKKILVRNHCFS